MFTLCHSASIPTTLGALASVRPPLIDPVMIRPPSLYALRGAVGWRGRAYLEETMQTVHTIQTMHTGCRRDANDADDLKGDSMSEDGKSFKPMSTDEEKGDRHEEADDEAKDLEDADEERSQMGEGGDEEEKGKETRKKNNADAAVVLGYHAFEKKRVCVCEFIRIHVFYVCILSYVCVHIYTCVHIIYPYTLQ